MSVSITPGLSGIAAIPFGSSWARASVSPSTANFEAQYGATSGDVDRPQPLDRLTITPALRATIAGTNARIALATPFTFTSISRSKSAAAIVHSGAGGTMIAALLTSRSGGPRWASTSLAQASTATASLTSTAVNWFGAPNSERSSRTWPADRPQPATTCPTRTNGDTRARPSPRVAPVTTITLRLLMGRSRFLIFHLHTPLETHFSSRGQMGTSADNRAPV